MATLGVELAEEAEFQGSSKPSCIVMPTAACRGKTPFPRAVSCWLAVRPCIGSVTHRRGRPINHSTNSGAGLGPLVSFRRAGAGAGLPIIRSHRLMAWA